MHDYECKKCGAEAVPAEVGSRPLDAPFKVEKTCACDGPVIANMSVHFDIDLSKLFASVGR